MKKMRNVGICIYTKHRGNTIAKASTRHNTQANTQSEAKQSKTRQASAFNVQNQQIYKIKPKKQPQPHEPCQSHTIPTAILVQQQLIRVRWHAICTLVCMYLYAFHCMYVRITWLAWMHAACTHIHKCIHAVYWANEIWF